ncbi:MAG: hypothetical protein IMZ75_06805 [Actinobacteria bacterium]|nr:hypothetical protein [Actinomycetota bacterium]
MSTRFIEKPAQSAILGFRGSLGQSWPKLAFGSLFTVVAVVPAVVLVLAVPTSQLATAGGKGPVGAELLAAGGKLTVVEAFPTEELAANAAATDLPVVNTNGCMLDHPTVAPKVCSFGDLGSDNVIALVGDSHAAMFIPGLEVVALEAGYRLDTYTKGSCPFVTLPIDFQKRDYKECGEWVRNVTDKLVKEKPVAVITAMSRAYSVFGTGLSIDESRQPISDSLGASWDKLEGAGIRVAAMRDVPRPGIVVPDCVAANPDNLSKCAVNQVKSLWEDGPEVRAAKTHPGVTIIDLTSTMCADGVCPAVINGIIVYRDSNHITATYSRSMHQQMAESLRGVLR